MRILLIKTCRLLTYEFTILSPPLGILSLASCLRELRGDDVRVLDLRLYKKKQKQKNILSNTLREFKPQVTGLSTLTYEHISMHETAKLIRDVLPNCIVIGGGPHPSMYPRRTLMDKNLDYIVLGEGEESLMELLAAISSRDDPRKILGIGGNFESEVFLNPTRPFIDNLNAYPIPAWDLYDPRPYQYAPRQTHAQDYLPYAGISTTRGCPYHCTFCHNLFGKKLRKRSIDHVAKEFEMLNKQNIRSIEFYDDSFNLNRRHMYDILDLTKSMKQKMNLSFPNGLRVDLLTNDDLDRLKNSGTYYLSVAIETASERLQKLIKKNLDLNLAKQTINESVRRRIFTNAFFLLGLPTETLAEMKKTVDFACHSPLHSAMFFTLIPHPATEIGKAAGIDELSAPIESWNYYMGVASLSSEPPEVVNTIQRQAHRRFHLSLKRGIRVLRDLPSYRKLWFILRGLLHLSIDAFHSSAKYSHYD